MVQVPGCKLLNAVILTSSGHILKVHDQTCINTSNNQPPAFESNSTSLIQLLIQHNLSSLHIIQLVIAVNNQRNLGNVLLCTKKLVPVGLFVCFAFCIKLTSYELMTPRLLCLKWEVTSAKWALWSCSHTMKLRVILRINLQVFPSWGGASQPAKRDTTCKYRSLEVTSLTCDVYCSSLGGSRGHLTHNISHYRVNRAVEPTSTSKNTVKIAPRVILSHVFLLRITAMKSTVRTDFTIKAAFRWAFFQWVSRMASQPMSSVAWIYNDT